MLEGVSVPWCVAAGWAIELFLGDRVREHEDLEIAVPGSRFDELAPSFAGYEWWVPKDGRLVPLADSDGTSHQTWVRDAAADVWRLDVFREPHEGETWICRRDPAIRMAYAQLIERTADGIPYVRPEVALLFKAKNDRGKDAEDLAATLPRLDGARRDWLRESIARVHPGHAWLERI